MGDLKITRSDAEWRQLLTPEQYRVTRQHGTERAFSHPLNRERAGVIRDPMLLIGGRLKRESDAVHAVASAGRLWSVGKDVAQMGITGSAPDFRAPHQPRPVVVLGNSALLDGSPEARPARPGIELGRRGKEWSATAHAGECAGALFIPGRGQIG
jgi:hypothetical protein